MRENKTNAGLEVVYDKAEGYQDDVLVIGEQLPPPLQQEREKISDKIDFLVEPEGYLKKENKRLKEELGQRDLIIEQKDAQLNQQEQQIRNSQKMEAIGTLAGSIAHDFNNLLGVIIGGIGLAKIDNEKGLKVADQGASRAKSLVFNLLTYIKNEKLEPISLDVLRVFREYQNLIQFATKGHEFNFIDYSEHKLTKINLTHLIQVILNLCANASQAMSSQGKVTLIIENEIIAELNLYNLEPMEYLKISIKDTGTGIPSNIIKKIFDSQFTTKAGVVNGGSGMGLTVSREIIQSYGGNIFVKSVVGEGSTFEVFLPVFEGKNK